MKFWKNWPPALPAGRYWVKGGLVGIGIGIGVIFALYVKFTGCYTGPGGLGEGCHNTFESSLAGIQFFIILPLGLFFRNFVSTSGFALYNTIVVIGCSSFFGIMGAILGWFYGKIFSRGGSAFGGKNRKSDSSPTL